jgi:hypothetical protein
LAIGGLCWGALLAPFVFDGRNDVLPFLVFGPGYVVTSGYLIRAFSTPPLGIRQGIWVLSLLVQGVWLVVESLQVLNSFRSLSHLVSDLLSLSWWFVATVASVVALATEKKDICETDSIHE